MSYSDRIRQERGLPEIPATDPRIQRLRQMGMDSVQNISGGEPFDLGTETTYNPVRKADRPSSVTMNKLRHMVSSDADNTIEGRLERIEALLTKLVKKHG